MKKTYVKPQIVFEDFALNTSIAAVCQNVGNFNNSGTTVCRGYFWESADTVIFNQENLCWATPQELNADFACYDVPSLSFNIQES